MDLMEKLRILADAAKYDVACTSSGASRSNRRDGGMGNAVSAGICHSFSADGRCISLLKVLMTNYCVYDCKYCTNGRSHDRPRAAFTPRELADLTISFYRRNYIEGLFLSSGILRNPDYTCEQMLQALTILRREYRFQGYIHVKGIPGADSRLIEEMGLLADRMSVNIELPSRKSLTLLAPDKTGDAILKPMKQISSRISENARDLTVYRSAPRFVPAGQSTQMIIGATPETDFEILRLSEALYHKYRLKRVFFSAYIPTVESPLLPSPDTRPPLLREHRLYQADWLLRFYGFSASELLDMAHPNFHPQLDPKCSWAVSHMEQFPVEVNSAPYEMLLRVPGIGVTSANRIWAARKTGTVTWDTLKKMGVVLKRAQYFITCAGRAPRGIQATPDGVLLALTAGATDTREGRPQWEQLSLFPNPEPTREDIQKCLSGQM